MGGLGDGRDGGMGEMGLGEVGGRRGRGAEEEDGEADWRCGWVVVAGAGI